MLKFRTHKRNNKIYKLGSAFVMAGLMGCGGGEVHDKDISDLHQKMVNLEDSMKKLPPNVAADGRAVQDLKKQLDDLNAKVESEGGSPESMASAHTKMGEVEALHYGMQTPFFKQCVASINIADAENLVKRNVVNAIAFINSSKIARATQVTQQDFDHATSIQSGRPTGYVFVGTKSELRDANKSHTYYAFSRLPTHREVYSYFDFDLVNSAISSFGATNIDMFSVSDKERVYRSLSGYEILVAQDANEAIDANKIESYSREDCEKIATYMSNVGSIAPSIYVDEQIFRPGLRNNIRKGNETFVADVLSRLHERFEAHMTAELKHAFRDTDSHRAMVLQDGLMRKDAKGQLDYSFLDLINAPHLRYFAAVDSEIGKARFEAGSDFDNAYQGKNSHLTEFVKRHRAHPGLKRVSKDYRELEAAFINFDPAPVAEPVVEAEPVPENFFHSN